MLMKRGLQSGAGGRNKTILPPYGRLYRCPEQSRLLSKDSEHGTFYHEFIGYVDAVRNLVLRSFLYVSNRTDRQPSPTAASKETLMAHQALHSRRSALQMTAAGALGTLAASSFEAPLHADDSAK